MADVAALDAEFADAVAAVSDFILAVTSTGVMLKSRTCPFVDPPAFARNCGRIHSVEESILKLTVSVVLDPPNKADAL